MLRLTIIIFRVLLFVPNLIHDKLEERFALQNTPDCPVIPIKRERHERNN